LDVVFAGSDNGPPGNADVATFRAAKNTAGETVADPSLSLRTVFALPAALPLIAYVDVRTQRVLATQSDPSPAQIRGQTSSLLVALDGTASSVPAQPLFPEGSWEDPLIDGRFNAAQWDLIAAMVLPDVPPPDPSNAVADDPQAAALGKQLFFEGSLSPRGVSCASCHNPALLFTDGKETPPEGVGSVDRNAPTTLLAGHHGTQLWDGRADSTWMQAVLPIEAPHELGSSRLFAVHAVLAGHREAYEATFDASAGPAPTFDDAARFPATGGPGDAAWEAMTTSDRNQITRAFTNIGKAIAAYERSLRPLPTALDSYARGDLTALTDAQKDGLLAFFRAGCAQCHSGPRLTNDAFHNLRFPTGRHDRAPDRGRIDGVSQLLASELNRGGLFSDDPATFVPPLPVDRLLGAFKTPTLRGVAYTLPYGHGGSYWGLTSVLEAIRTGGLPADSAFAVGDAEPFLPRFDAALIPSLITFLTSLRLDTP
jgi:cytochrome c peroxidase